MGNVQPPKPPNGRAARPVKGNGAIEMDPRQLLRALTALGRGDFTVRLPDDWVGLGATNQSPESTGTAGTGYFEWPFHLTQGQWTMPMTNKLLLEGNLTIFRYNPAFGFPPPDGITNLIPVQEQSTDLRCVGTAPGGRPRPRPGRARRRGRSRRPWGGRGRPGGRCAA